MNVRLHIERLVLEGFPPGDRDRIAAALETELTRLFTEQGAPPGLEGGGRVPALDGGSFDLAPGAPPQQVGAQAAQSLYGGLSR